MRQGLKGSARIALLTLLTLLTASPAIANVITVDARDFKDVTSISYSIPGVTITALVQPYGGTVYDPVREEVFVDPNWVYLDGSPPQVAGAFFSASAEYFGVLDDWSICYRAGVSPDCGTALAVLELVFDSPVDYLKVGGSHPADAMSILAFDSAGGMFGCRAGSGSVCESYNDDGFRNYMSMYRSERDISRVWVAAAFGVSTVNYFSFGTSGVSVPEPGSLALLGLGLAGLGLSRRRRVN